jgi:cytoplasmic iron level regulating protein YaaA (DUF328/UPF0246 family)
MRVKPQKVAAHTPHFLAKARELNEYLKTLSREELKKEMHLSSTLAEKTKELIARWNDTPAQQTPAIDCFIGDIYSGLRAGEFTEAERQYAHETLGILSGQYGLLRSLDGIMPYRLEMGYTFADSSFKTLYSFWGDRIAKQLPEGLIINASSAEYMRSITPFVDLDRIITPNFLTVDPRTNEPIFRAVHAKIARGAFARWLVTTRITDPRLFKEFNDLGYRFDSARSTDLQPTFICQEFGGKGLSIRLAP